jgi:WD40 repeat protein
MTCCLNPACDNPENPEGTMFCSKCSTGLVLLRNRYRPIKSLGAGGFGKTYLAEDKDKLNERCVIKQFAPHIQGTAALKKATELFDQEARRLQVLGEHPQIPTLLAYFEEDSRLYLVQQFIDGQNLFAQLQQQGTFSEQEVRELLLDLLNILQTVHQHKVIHRDIKPENIIRRSDGKLVLIDFGASKQLTMTVTTQPGTTIGSFGYAPPEQMQDGEALPASDLYSVGATCFHLLSGIPPWQLWKRQAYGWVANWRQHLQQPISHAFGEMLDKLLQEEYQQRYQSIQQVLQDLNSLLSPSILPPTQPIIATPSSSPSTLPPTQPIIATPSSPPSTLPPTQPIIATPSSSPSTLPPTQPIIATPSSPPSTLPPTQSVVATPSLPPEPEILTPPIKPKASPQKFFRPNTKLKKGLLAGVAITLSGLIFGYVRHNLSPTERISTNNPTAITPRRSTDTFLQKTLTGHSYSVNSLAISPDNNILASGSVDNTIKLWNLVTGEQIRTLKEHSNSVRAIAISPDGKTLASGSNDETIKLWNLATGELIRNLKGHSSWVRAIAISPDGKILVSGSDDETIKLWNLTTGELIRTLKENSESAYHSVYAVAISPDGKSVASGTYGNTIKLWNLATGELIRTLKGHSNSVNAIAISPDGKSVASASDDRSIKLWNLVTGKLIRTLKGYDYPVSSLAISPDSKILTSGSNDQTIKLWNLATGEQIRTFKGHSDSVVSVAISPDGKILVSGSADKTIKIWRLN